MSFQEYKQLTTEEREFFTFQQLSKIDQLDTLADRFAGKWVEKAAITVVLLITAGFLGTLMYAINWHPVSASTTQ